MSCDRSGGGARTLPVPEELTGIPYRFGGRNLEGVDCLGLVWLYFRRKGLDFPDSDGLPLHGEVHPDYLKRVTQALEAIASPVSHPRADDIVVMRLPGSYVHLGVMVDDHNMLHVLKGRPSCIVPLRRFRSRIVNIYRLYGNRG